MKIRKLPIDGPLLIEPKRFHDLQGFSCETYNAADLARHGMDATFIQDNLSLVTGVGTVRGLHFQRPPFAQTMLLRAVRGSIFAVAVDLRKDSTSYGRHASVELNAENGLQLYVPEGFAHGFATLRPLTEICRKVSMPDARGHKNGIFWDDPALRISWPVTSDAAVISTEDNVLPLLGEIETPFKMAKQERGVAA